MQPGDYEFLCIVMEYADGKILNKLKLYRRRF